MIEFAYPTQAHIPGLLALWRLSFDVDEFFLQDFFSAAYHPSRCRIALDGCKVLSMLYWFDCQWGEEKIAYLYAISTAKAHRGKGLASALMHDTHRELAQLGYAGAILVPANQQLFSFYETKGYRTMGFLNEGVQEAGAKIHLRPIDAPEYALLRRRYLPENGLIQEGANLAFLTTMARLYAGDDFIAAVLDGPEPCILELLGNAQAAPGILASLSIPNATVRTPGSQKPFAMGRWFTQNPPPESLYLGFAFE